MWDEESHRLRSRSHYKDLQVHSKCNQCATGPEVRTICHISTLGNTIDIWVKANIVREAIVREGMIWKTVVEEQTNSRFKVDAWLDIWIHRAVNQLCQLHAAGGFEGLDPREVCEPNISDTNVGTMGVRALEPR